MSGFVRVQGTANNTLSQYFATGNFQFTIAQVKTRSTFKESLWDFLSAIVLVKNGKSSTISGFKVEALLQEGVDFSCGGRSSVYDLMWFTSNPGKVYAYDSKDDEYIYVLEI
jgi:hypothetical protein